MIYRKQPIFLNYGAAFLLSISNFQKRWVIGNNFLKNLSGRETSFNITHCYHGIEATERDERQKWFGDNNIDVKVCNNFVLRATPIRWSILENRTSVWRTEQ